MDRGDLQLNPPPPPRNYFPQQQQNPQAALAAVTGAPPAAPAPPPLPKTDTDPTPRPTTSSTEKSPFDDGTTSGEGSSPRREKSDPYGRPGGVTIAPPPRARSVRDGPPYRPGENVMSPMRHRGSGLDWVVPVAEGGPQAPRAHTVGERLQPTIDNAQAERDKFAKRAFWNGWALNIAIGLQVILGALVTGLSSAISPSKVGVTVTTLGGLSTFCASYLARMRGSHEPELSIGRVKDLDQFIRECDSFHLDRGHITGNSEDAKLEEFRKRFEELLGNTNDSKLRDQQKATQV